MKRRQDDLAMAEIYLRDQATREQWLNSPRFRDELAAIEAQRVSVRDEIGDEAYDRFLFAQGQTNRVRVDDVMLDSVAAQAGLQTGDILLRYGDDRIFAPEELVNATRSGRAGESIRLEILRNGARIEVQVPRGPLGLRIAASQSEPTS
jgi:S1-C subfamily serine protease